MKGLILCAGKGTRLQPLSLSQPKALLPVANKPIIFYLLEHFKNLAIYDVGVVINRSQEVYFKEKLGLGEKFDLSISYIFQDQPKGIADAVRQAKSFIKEDPFLLLLGDNLICDSLLEIKEWVFQQKSNAALILTRVHNPEEFGIAEIRGDHIIRLEEKPISPKSNLAVVGAYAFDRHIFEAVESISPSARGEYEITDAIQWLIDQGYQVTNTISNGQISDVGTVERLLEANQFMLNFLGNQSSMQNVLENNCIIIPPVIIAEGCYIKDAIIGPYVSIAQDVFIECCTIENSIVFEGVHLQKIPYKIRNSIFGQKSTINGVLDTDNNSAEYILSDRSSVLFKRN